MSISCRQNSLTKVKTERQIILRERERGGKEKTSGDYISAKVAIRHFCDEKTGRKSPLKFKE